MLITCVEQLRVQLASKSNDRALEPQPSKLYFNINGHGIKPFTDTSMETTCLRHLKPQLGNLIREYP